mmetsp:Transcript_43928/g.125725  ORF Transcript_43928/g.125725 Transcript_43928/m.125725 type:complete len:214 (+) Transcript_43928:709-1350(+)
MVVASREQQHLLAALVECVDAIHDHHDVPPTPSVGLLVARIQSRLNQRHQSVQRGGRDADAGGVAEVRGRRHSGQDLCPDHLDKTAASAGISDVHPQLLQLLLDALRGIRHRTLREHRMHGGLHLLLHESPDARLNLGLHGRDGSGFRLSDHPECLRPQLCSPFPLLPVMPDEALHVLSSVGAFRILHCGLQIVLQVAQPRGLIHSKLHQTVL